VKAILDKHFDTVKGMIHCSGGGQTKCMKYLPGPMRIVKDNFMMVEDYIYDNYFKEHGDDLL
jgi:phosphoribosylformylglycinamidine cyclo-ligase